MESTNILFTPITKRDTTFSKKVAMCALTRNRADQDGTPNEINLKYYTERAADAAFVLTECVAVSARGHAFPGAACMFTDSHEEGWKKIVESVHAVDGKIHCQVFHAGRAVPGELLGDVLPLAPSSILNRHSTNIPGLNYVKPQEMTSEDILTVQGEFLEAVKRVKRAGFDAIEFHNANGYLLDQFLRSATNQRTDSYGGSVENRCRFILEIIDQATEVFDANKIGIKLSPVGSFMDMNDENPEETYSYLLQELDKRGILYVEVMEPGTLVKQTFYYDKIEEDQLQSCSAVLKKHFTGGIYIANNKLTPEVAAQLINDGQADMVTFGKLYIPNPDLTKRLENGWSLNDPDYSTFMGPHGAKGYTDYPHYEA